MALGTLERLEDRLADLCGHRNTLDALLVQLVAEALETGAWEMDGIHSPAHWLAWKAGLSSAHAQQLVTVAKRRGELPVTFAAFDAGELSLDQVVPIATRAPRWADGELCEFAKLATVTQLRRVLRSYDFPPDPTTDDDDQPAGGWEPVELLSLWHGDDGRWELRGELDADHGAMLNTALREAQDALFQRDGVVVSQVEALVEIANRSLDTITDPARRDRYRVHVHVDVDNTMLDGLGYRLPTWLRDLICCDTIVSTVNKADGIPVSVGRTQRTVPERTRRLVILRDRGCRVPGCTADRFLHVHHVIHWDPDDGRRPDRHIESGVFCVRVITACITKAGWGSPATRTTRTDSSSPTVLAGSCTPPRLRDHRPGHHPNRPAATNIPSGERLQMHWVTFNPPRPPAPTDTN